jgi:hypothetical protein
MHSAHVMRLCPELSWQEGKPTTRVCAAYLQYDPGNSAVIYFGSTENSPGRLRDQFGWTAKVAAINAAAPVHTWASHPRGCARRGAVTLWAAVPDEPAARAWELRLLPLHVAIAGIPPIVNGKAWDASTENGKTAETSAIDLVERGLVGAP